MSPRYAFPRVSVAGRPAVEVCVDLDAGDVVAPWLLEHDWIDEPVQRLFLDFVKPGARVLDLGSHLGLFSLTAAKLGADVLALDATPMHVEQVRLAAERGGLAARLRVVHGLIADGTDPLAFVESSIHGHVHVGHVRTGDEADDEATIELLPVTVDALLDDAGWDGLDLVKMDIEGFEPAALRGMRRMFARGSRPVIILEGNGGMLRIFGSSPEALLGDVHALGYELLQVDHLHPGELIPVTAEHVQPECVVDYLAVPEGHGRLPGSWLVRPPLTRDETLTRMIDQAAVDAWGFRRWVADVLGDGPAWLRGDALMAPVAAALARDLDHRVRKAMRDAGPRPESAAAPGAAEADADLVVLARDATVIAATEWLARAPGQPAPAPAPVRVAGVSLHVRRGELVGVLARADDERAALVELLAGWVQPASGTIARAGTPLVLSRIADVVEPDFTVAENLVVLAAFLGADSAQALARAADFAVLAELDADDLEAPLSRLPVAGVARLAVVVALDDPHAELIVLDGVTASGSPQFAERLRDRVAELRGDGVAFVQTVTTPGELVGPAERMAWLGHGRLLAAGHCASVADVALRDALGVPRERGEAALR